MKWERIFLELGSGKIICKKQINYIHISISSKSRKGFLNSKEGILNFLKVLISKFSSKHQKCCAQNKNIAEYLFIYFSIV